MSHRASRRNVESQTLNEAGEEFVSEPIVPLIGAVDTRAMGRGEPGLPSGFRWRSGEFRIAAELQRWKESAPEGGSGEVYLRRHVYRLQMDDGSIWTVYFTRQAPRGGSPRRRWFLYCVSR